MRTLVAIRRFFYSVFSFGLEIFSREWREKKISMLTVGSDSVTNWKIVRCDSWNWYSYKKIDYTSEVHRNCEEKKLEFCELESICSSECWLHWCWLAELYLLAAGCDVSWKSLRRCENTKNYFSCSKMRVSATVGARDVNSFEILWNYVTAALILDSVHLVVAWIAYFSAWVVVEVRLKNPTKSRLNHLLQNPQNSHRFLHNVRSHVDRECQLVGGRSGRNEKKNNLEFNHINSHHRRFDDDIFLRLRILHIIVSSRNNAWLWRSSQTLQPAHYRVRNEDLTTNKSRWRCELTRKNEEEFKWKTANKYSATITCLAWLGWFELSSQRWRRRFDTLEVKFTMSLDFRPQLTDYH